VVVQTSVPDEFRARAMAVWAAAFVGFLPFGGLITAGLAELLGAGGAVTVDALLMLAGGAVLFARHREVAWLGCASLPQACVAGVQPEAVAMEREEAKAA
jgi:hypothetical protein